MGSQTMQEIENQSSNPETLDSMSIQSIQLADGWHNVSQCEIVPFAVTNSPVYSYFPSLKYQNEQGQTVYTPLKRILSFSSDLSTNQSSGSQNRGSSQQS